MGIKNLTKVISDHAPSAIKQQKIVALNGIRVAIDASMSLYQFLIAVRQGDGQQLVNEAGETTSHLMGIFYRTIRMIESGIYPVYVFDGKPPVMKRDELAKRGERRAEAESSLKAAEESGDTENIDKFSRRTVKVTQEHANEAKKLLTLLGIPFVDAPCEAEAQCAALCKANLVQAAGSEDMDTLTFGAPMLMRHLTFSEARKMDIEEFNLEKVLKGLDLTMDQFTDMCILLGCDYCEPVKGVGAVTAFHLIKEHGSLEVIIEKTSKKYTFPEDWPYKEVRELFKNPDVIDPVTIEPFKFLEPDVEGVVDYLVKDKNFNEKRVRDGVAKLIKQRGKGTQPRLDSFFKPVEQDPSKDTKKRKAETAKGPTSKKATGATKKPAASASKKGGKGKK
ncbi:Elongation of fatty acids protein 2 [Nowakowskiella sp. JEL0078]|nr:Elongation of fatty acids protein 2 [Nowakowskiella sp. JEL0078]